MILSPPKQYRPRPYALLTPNASSLRVQTLDKDVRYTRQRDIANALERLKGAVCYTPARLKLFRDATDPTEWVLTTWRGRPVNMVHKPTGVAVTSLRGALNDAPDMFTALSEYLDWLVQFRVAPGTVSTMGWNLLRASLTKELNISFDPAVSDAAFFGGRQEVFLPARYENMVALDIKAAYPHAMASEPMALSLREVSPTTHLTDEPGFAAAEVFVPLQLAYAPLPVRLGPRRIQFQYHELRGIWTWREIRAAMALGCDVRVIKCWAPRRTYDLFGPWWNISKQGRALSTGADMMAKMVANSTWGQFAMKGEEKFEHHFTGHGDLDFVDVRLPAKTMPHIYMKHIASEISSRVRVKTLMEGLYGIDGFVAHVDTDGVIVSGDAALPPNSGDAFGQWRVKDLMEEVDIRAPQLFRYHGPHDRAWKFVAAGMNIDAARLEFSRHRRQRTKISYLSEEDVNYPSQPSHMKYEREQLIKEGEAWGL